MNVFISKRRKNAGSSNSIYYCPSTYHLLFLFYSVFYLVSVHFLGGAFVGAAPHVTYRYMLEKLASKGYLVVATPYDLSFDHLNTCDLVISRFEKIAPTLARTYGALPVVGIGHSLGALLHLLITSLFPDTPRAANALVSFNNKPVGEAVPFFEEVRSTVLYE